MRLTYAHAWAKEKIDPGGPTTGYSTSVVWTASHAATDRTWQKPQTLRGPESALRQTKGTRGLTMRAWRRAHGHEGTGGGA